MLQLRRFLFFFDFKRSLKSLKMMRAQAHEFLKTDLISKREGEKNPPLKKNIQQGGEKIPFAIF